MSDRHDLRRQTKEIQDALSRFDREQLVDILVHVFRTYVLEGASLSSASVSAPPIADELQGLSFPQVIERLQLRLELPELQLFELQGGRVHVRVDGRLQPIELPTARGDAPSHLQVQVAPPSSPAAAPPRVPGVEVREVVMPPAAAASATQSASSRPDPRPGAVRATSASASASPAATPRPAAAAASAPSGPAPASPSTAAPAAPPAPPKPDRAPEPTGTGGAGRFGLLEID